MNGEVGKNPEESSSEKKDSTRQSKGGKQWSLWRKFTSLSGHNQISVASSAIVALATVTYVCIAAFQLHVMKKAAIDSGFQTDQLISAAKFGAYASKQNAQAAASFAESARNINEGINEAVDRLNVQAGATGRLAVATESANANVVSADQPWMGGYITVTNFILGKKPVVTVTFSNSGKRPARLDLTAVKEEAREVFPKNPDADYIFDTAPSTSVIVPGQPSVTSQTLGEVIQSDLDLLDGGKFTYFIFAKVEYRDLRTNEHHWTHICMRYIPKMKTESDNGFRNCQEYNDAE